MLVLVNHKANFLLEEIKPYEKEIKELNLIIFPTLCYLPFFQDGNYILGAQDISEFEEKERTGEINGKQLKSLNVKYCLIGHKDRRTLKHETKKTLIKKVEICLENNIVPLYCLKENSSFNMREVNKILNLAKDKEIILIYEPYKNIGTNSPDLSKIEEYIGKLKKYVLKKYNKKIKILCGGGINLNNINYIKSIKNIDGIIISNASLNINELKQIYKSINN